METSRDSSRDEGLGPGEGISQLIDEQSRGISLLYTDRVYYPRCEVPVYLQFSGLLEVVEHRLYRVQGC